MAITAADVKKLRDATGAGMMDAKKPSPRPATSTRPRGPPHPRPASRPTPDREATNGIVAGRDGALIQFAAETDFVARTEFVELADQILDAASRAAPPTWHRQRRRACFGRRWRTQSRNSAPRSARTSPWPTSRSSPASHGPTAAPRPARRSASWWIHRRQALALRRAAGGGHVADLRQPHEVP